MTEHEIRMLLAYVATEGVSQRAAKDLCKAYVQTFRKPCPACCGGKLKVEPTLKALTEHYQ